MSAPTNRWKLGAFVVGSVLLGLSGGAVLVSRALQIETVTYVSYFDEAVTGLAIGSPISFRGVALGNISKIDVAPDRRHVELTYTLGVSAIERLGLTGVVGAGGKTFSVPPGLRVQIASTGLTGNRYLDMDFFDAEAPPALPFPVPANTIPATPSTMKSLEAAMVRAVDRLPLLVEELSGVAVQAKRLLDEVGERKLPARMAATLEGTDRLVAALQGKVGALPVAELSGDLRVALASVDRSLGKLDRVLDQLEGANLESLDGTGRDVREAAVAVRQLVDALQRDPDMLLKGKTKVAR